MRDSKSGAALRRGDNGSHWYYWVPRALRFRNFLSSLTQFSNFSVNANFS